MSSQHSSVNQFIPGAMVTSVVEMWVLAPGGRSLGFRLNTSPQRFARGVGLASLVIMFRWVP